ncbi:hypothetical protein BDQ17DRAFT_1314076 [Cyathus striatus]|nr:hypothetical protein BDQ17DRAFT_1314076 [Cyathus striatus]
MSDIGEQPPQKRCRTDDIESKPEPSRHTKFWFDDGSVVLCVQSTLFRVHRSILCIHSEVFKGMFEIPQPEMPEKFDGCPYVELPDELKDIETFMTVLYNPLCWDQNNSTCEEEVTFAMSILKISNKYGCHLLHKKAVSILKEQIPTDISNCEQVVQCHQLITHTVAGLLSLAREANLRILMPCVIYLLWARQEPATLIKSVRAMSPEDTQWEDVAVSLAGRATLLTVQRDDMFKFVCNFVPSTSCQARIRSGPSIGSSCTLTYDKNSLLRQSKLYAFELSNWKDGILKTLCEACRTQANEVYNEGLQKFWNTLPGAFGLESWEVLEKEAKDFD